MKLTESKLLQNFTTALRGQLGLEATDDDAANFYEVIFAATSDFLRVTKSKDKKIALLFEDLKGNMLAAAVVEYNVNEGDDEGQDNWNYYWTFDKADVEDATTYSASQQQIQSTFTRRAATMHHMEINVPTTLARMISLAISILSDYLDENAKAGETFSVEHEGFFVARCEVDGEIVVKAVVPDGAMKVLIKDDEALEK